MGKTLYLECTSGIAGDMLAAALLDLGADENRLRQALGSLGVEGFQLQVGRVVKNGIAACDFDVRLAEGLHNHDHDMAWLYGHLDTGRAHEHEHEHEHEQHSHAHAHGHRTLSDVMAILDAARLSPRARDIARRTFEVLARAEAKAHGTTPDQVRFHEVGAVDSIVDITACAVCLDDLDIEDVVVPSLCEGTGTVRCAHGILPVPVPAVAAIACEHGIDLHVLPVARELVTPTGAALVAAARTRRDLPERFRITASGVGAGKRDNPGTSGVLRAHLIEETPAPLRQEHMPASEPAPDAGQFALPCNEGRIWKLECDVDDSTGEALGHCMGRLLDAGAREAHFVPVFTKKNRPAWQVQVICDEERRTKLESILFQDTTTIGVRRTPVERTALPRHACTLQTPLGPVEAKQVTLPDGSMRTYPEHEAVARLARQAGLGYQDALRIATAASLQA